MSFRDLVGSMVIYAHGLGEESRIRPSGHIMLGKENEMSFAKDAVEGKQARPRNELEDSDEKIQRSLDDLREEVLRMSNVLDLFRTRLEPVLIDKPEKGMDEDLKVEEKQPRSPIRQQVEYITYSHKKNIKLIEEMARDLEI